MWIDGDISASGDLYLETSKKIYFDDDKDTYMTAASDDSLVVRVGAIDPALTMMDAGAGTRLIVFGDPTGFDVDYKFMTDGSNPDPALFIEGSSGNVGIGGFSNPVGS